ncbi:stage II sporulation protein M [Mediterraneibacter agrestimuris]|uniref:stage II sporulation protein M n=1 Tax=Mediterraneibacter agrestimuris TaxID=2941333 RepID=UPI002041BA19|nr:stage II sporulation protein M [Mediterraneibacter agrestimuris]
MKTLQTKKRMFAFFMPGFLLGILYVNLIAGQYLAESGIFSEYFLKQYALAEVTAPEYIVYLAGTRLFPFLVMTGLIFTRARRIAAGIFLVWTGFLGGMLLTMAAFSMGVKGIILCIVGVMPQFILYIPAYVVLLWYAMTVSISTWNRQKTVFVVLMMTMGIVLEAYINPLFLQVFLKTL